MREANEGWAAFVMRLVDNEFGGNASALAKALDVSASTVTRWIDGATPDIGRLKVMARVTGVPMVELLTAAGALDEPPGEGQERAASDRVDVRWAVERDPDLIEEAREHLLNQYELLRRLSVPADSKEGRRPATPADQRPLRAVARKRPPRNSG